MQHLWAEGDASMKSLSLTEAELQLFRAEAEKLGLEDDELITQLVRKYLRRQNRKKL